jgi:hypothetical protein
MENDAEYASLDPVALCAFLQEQYGHLVTCKMWPALSTSLPKSNLASVASGESSTVRVCYKYGATDHLHDKCPQLGRGGCGRGHGHNSTKGTGNGTTETALAPSTGGGGGGGGSNHGTSDATHTAFPPWHYIKPADPSVAITIGTVT